MAGIFFQPQQPDYRGLWDWNPVQTFITSKNELEAANLRQAESDRLKAKTDLDMRVAETLLPLNVEESRAKIASTYADIGLKAAQAKYWGTDRVKQLTAAQQRFNAASDPEALSKGNSLIGTPFSTPTPTETLVPTPTGFESINTSPESSLDLSQAMMVDDQESFLTQFAGELPNPATSLEPNNYDISKTSGEMSADMNGGAMQLPQVSEKDAAEIKNMARGGARTEFSGAQADMARSVVNPLGEAKSSNPLDDFNVDPESAMQDTLAKNSGAFASSKKVVKEPAPPSLGQQISAFNNWSSSAKRKISELSRVDPAAHVYAVKSFNDNTDRFLEQLGSSYDSDEVNFLTRNPSRADAYAQYKNAGLSPDEAVSLTGMSPNHAKGILSVFKEGRLPDGSQVIAESLEDAKMIYTNAVRQGMKTTKEEDSIERATKAQAFIDAVSKKPEAERTEEDIMALERAGADRDAALQLPQGASKLGGQLNRYFRQNQQLEEARNMGLPEFELGGKTVTEAEYDSTIAANMNKIQSIAIKNAPSFKDSAERDAWFSSEETKNLPFKMSIGGKPTIVYRTEDPNVVTSYVANGKKGPEWVNYNMGGEKKETPPPVTSAKAEPDGLMQEEETMLVKLAKTLPGKTKQAVSDFSDAVARSEIGRIPELEAAIKKIDEELTSNKTFETALLPDRKGNRRLDKPLTPQERNQLIRNRNAYLIQLKGLKKRNPAPPTEYSTPTQSDL